MARFRFALLLVLLPLPRAGAEDVDFRRDVLPILSNHCWACHGPDEKARKAKLRLDSAEAALATRRSGQAIIPGKPDTSEVVVRVESGDADAVMPPPEFKKPLTDKQKATLRKWIASGAKFAEHWAFVSPKRPDVPATKFAIRNPIDAFVFSRLEKDGLTPSPEAEKSVWLRRVTLDLTGLPPTLEELDAFRKDTAPDAYGKVVDRLLASPRHAERMAMHWLDAARYADTNGYNNDELRTMWPWRDWVIDAYARNLPYDQFLIEQLAGDLLPNATVAQRVATGFNRNHVLTTEGGIIEEEYRAEYVADRVHTASTVFMAISVQCARCHDHKFDPVSQKDFYRLASFFNTVPDRVVGYGQGVRMAEPVLKVPSAEQTAALSKLDRRREELNAAIANRAKKADTDVEAWEKSLKPGDPARIGVTGVTPFDAARIALEKPLAALAAPPDQRTAAQHATVKHYYLDRFDAFTHKLRTELATLPAKAAEIEKTIPVTMVMQDIDKRKTFVLIRGAYDKKGDEVQPGVPERIFAGPTAPRNRLDLAKWLVHPDHPLTARVAVNRWWEMLFGTGLVETSEDFGIQGSPPSNPELLDWLATELVRTKWDQRAMLKWMVLSATYRQSSNVSPALLERDPRNRLFARGPRHRLPGEMVRDQALFVSGLLKEKIGGPSVKPYQPDGLWEDVSVERREKYTPDAGDGLYRRSLYTFWKRTCPPPGLSTFDAPDRETCVVRRARTNTPLQALALLNDPTYVEAARKLAERVLASGKTDAARMAVAWTVVLGRDPRPEEAKILQGVLDASRTRYAKEAGAAGKLLAVGRSPRDPKADPAELAAWTVSMSALLNLDEAISKP
jgi:hypothetical protein